MHNNKITKINIAVTNRCNLECKHCGLWRQKTKKEISPALLNELLCSSALADCADITLTGGEPFLHPKIYEITETILAKRKNSLKTIVTNGILVGNICGFLEKFSRRLDDGFSLHISFDGLSGNKEQRGIPKSIMLKNIAIINRSFPRLKIVLKFTVSALNYFDIIPTYRFASSKGLKINIKLIENCPSYTNSSRPVKTGFSATEKRFIVKSLQWVLKQEQQKHPENALFITRQIDSLLGKKIVFSCKTPFERIFVFPDGGIYSCLYDKKIGNLKNTALDTLWQSQRAKDIRQGIISEGCCGCTGYHGFAPAY